MVPKGGPGVGGAWGRQGLIRESLVGFGKGI